MNYIEDLSKLSLFTEISFEEIKKLLHCTGAICRTYKKDELIIEEGKPITDFGIMLSGSGCSIKWNASGRQIIITLLEKGSMIGILIASKAMHKSPLTVQATSDSQVLRIPFNSIITRCMKNCPCHEKLLRNYISVIAEKGLELHERINCLLEPTVRDKIMTYLRRIAHQQNSHTFTIPINRNIMAEYLNIERSALSRELSKMKKDGLIDYHRNSFRLQKTTPKAIVKNGQNLSAQASLKEWGKIE
ncbi:MAG: Crp/Fnr family transcriptional regulator [Defluviitaleaceae bacterium]|nr:Crp/Fnr family transcriptional regulator [Defluviitaleaceae bacterium]